MVRLPKGFIPSEASASLRFLGSCAKVGYKESNVFHYVQSVGCLVIPSILLSSTCHLKYLESCTPANNHFILAIIGKYQQTFAGRLLAVAEPSVPSPSLPLYRESPQVGQNRISTNSFLYRRQSFGHAWILRYSKPTGHNIFFAS